MLSPLMQPFGQTSKFIGFGLIFFVVFNIFVMIDISSFANNFFPRYAMVFVPFVAIYNHKRTVVVGAALMHSETIADYTWLLTAFLKAHGSEPSFVITDQCPAMKQAIPIVFPFSIYRLCMWHRTKKVKAKV